MRARSTILGSLIIFSLLMISIAAFAENLPASASAAQTNTAAAADPLLQLLVAKGLLNAEEAKSLVGTPAEQRAKLLALLRQKGILSASDYEALATPSASAQVAPNLVASTSPIIPADLSQSSSKVVEAPQPAAPAVIPAIVPIRVFPIDPPKTGGLSGLKVGPITLAPYGFIKATVVHDSSSPDGDDFPFPGIWLNAGGNSTFNTGPTEDPEFHVKARATRFGMNFEWPDISPKLTLTGKIEGDFEGNFNESDNSDVTSIRTPNPRLRLAFVRLDYHASDKTDFYFKGGQDWTLYGSGALMNIVETTFNGALWGNSWERSPQLVGGFVQTLNQENSVKLEGAGGIMMPSTGQILKLGNAAGLPAGGGGLAGQLGQGEREGADSDRPEWEGRVALSFQLDKAKGVAPAQISFSGSRSSRTSIVPNSSYASAADCATGYYNLECSLEAAFPNGFQASSKMWAGQIVAQLPTRWFTVVATAYKGGDMRFYLGGQLNTYFTDVSGFTATSGPYVTADGGPLAAAGGAVLGCTTALNEDGSCPSGSAAVAPQRPIRAFGGFLQLGLPLSRWFNANPKGHNAGWQLYFTVGKDQVVDRDLNNPSGTFCGLTSQFGPCAAAEIANPSVNSVAPLPMSMGKMFAGTLYYKVNNWAQFGFEQSIYATRAMDHINLYTIAGTPSNEWQDHRTEFGPIFTF